MKTSVINSFPDCKFAWLSSCIQSQSKEYCDLYKKRWRDLLQWRASLDKIVKFCLFLSLNSKYALTRFLYCTAFQLKEPMVHVKSFHQKKILSKRVSFSSLDKPSSSSFFSAVYSALGECGKLIGIISGMKKFSWLRSSNPSFISEWRQSVIDSDGMA